jgi:hypothetical protein
MSRRLLVSLALALAALSLAAPTAQAGFGIKSLETATRNRDGRVDLQAGSHPYEYELRFTMNQNGLEEPEGTIRDVMVELPPGLVGDPQATARCSGFQFEGSFPRCPGSSQIGEASIEVTGLPLVHEVPIYNLTPGFGVAASIGFSLINLNSFQEASIRTGTDYGVNITDRTIPTDVKIQGVRVRIWGAPAEASHDAERECFNFETEGFEHPCGTDERELPFLSLPTSCGAPLVTTLKVNSLDGEFDEMSTESLGEGGIPEGIKGCEAPAFEPGITAHPQTAAAESPSGLHFNLHLPQNRDPRGIATAHLRDVHLTLPRGLDVNPSAASGLGAGGAEQIGLKSAPGQTPIEFTPGPAQCPPAAKLGTVAVHTPLLDHPLPGTVYLARQGENPFGSLIALYVTVDDPSSGVVVKLAGEVDPSSGQLVARFPDNPQLPFEDFEVDFEGGPRASLTTPPTCGTYTTTSDLTPWSAPQGRDAFPDDAFATTTGASGGPCPATEAQMPNSPSFEAGTQTPLAGAYSPFVMELRRENGSQRFGALNLTLPPGLAANFRGVPECSDAQIAQAAARSHPGEGAAERSSPSCPAASQLGTVTVGAGSGDPFYVQGRAYLAGPYKGAPFSLAIITPAIAGPFDLGTVVVRAGLYVNETTGQATVKSDPIPIALAGIPLDVRSIAVRVDRSGYVLNPTSCETMAVRGEEVSAAGQIAPLRDRFQLGGCKGLDFSPKLRLSMTGATGRSGHPALTAVLTQPAGQANIARTAVILPAGELIAQNHISNPCTRPQFVAGACPPGSVLGTARVFTPLLDQPLEGPIYFRANGGERELPDVVVDLHGKVHIVLVGFVDAVHRKGSETSRIRNTFATIPDDPVSKAILSFKGGKKGLLENSTDICQAPAIATVKMVAHNNKATSADQRIATSCPKKGKR